MNLQSFTCISVVVLVECHTVLVQIMITPSINTGASRPKTNTVFLFVLHVVNILYIWSFYLSEYVNSHNFTLNRKYKHNTS
jgi:hypothetical protein